MKDPSTGIVLYAGGDRSVVQPEDVYFTFGSGRFSYDCVACNAQCCRGHDYAVTVGRELNTQLRHRPMLPLFVERAGNDFGTQLTVRNCPPGCFFLAEGGLCSIHRADGYNAKPETCRLFPFNTLGRIGRYLVVSQHRELCPLSVNALGTRSSHSDYSALIDAMRADGIHRAVPEYSASARSADEIIATERQVLATTESLFGKTDYLSCVDAQCVIDDSESYRYSQHSTRQFVSTVRDLLGTPDVNDIGRDPRLVNVMLAATPYIRSRFIFQTEGQENRAALPVAKLPLALLSLYLLAEAARAAGTGSVTFQTLTRLMLQFRSVIEILVDLDEIVVWRRDADVLAALGDGADRVRFLKLSQALLPDRQRERRTRLQDILLDSAPLDPIEKSLFVKAAARRLAGRIEPLRAAGNSVVKATFSTRVRRWISRITLSHLTEDVVSDYERRRNTQPS